MARRKVDFAVLEVGMGGRFDATNIVEPLVAVITNVGLDHTERLGDTIEKIAFEKAGIVKTGGVLVTAVDREEAWRVILKRCREEGAEVWRVVGSHARRPDSPSADVQLRFTDKGSSFSLHGGEVHMMGLSPALKGRFQNINAATAAAAVLAMEKYEVRISPQAMFAGVANAYIPGRLELIRDKPKLVIDGAHNPDAARALASAVADNFKYDNLILVIGMLDNHSPDGVLAALGPMADRIVATQSTWMKALPATEIAAVARRFCSDVEVVDSVPAAVKHAVETASEKDLILVTGSFYTIGESPT
jgi:dihydrofolate synthase/folylpolyglutamate synthase